MISQETESWLSDLLARVDPDHSSMSAWDRKFLSDIRERYEEHGSGIFLSPKQILALNRIDEKTT